MAQENAEQFKSTNVKHRTATLDGVHNKNKALYRLGVTAAEIHRSKALQTMGGSEDTYQQSLDYLTRNKNPIKLQIPPSKQDPLEHEYTKNSETAETIDQSWLNSEKRESVSLSITWTHSHNHSNVPPRSNKSKSKSKSNESEEKKSEPLKYLKSISLESDSRSDVIDEILNEKQRILNENDNNNNTNNNNNNNNNTTRYAQDDTNNDSAPIVSAKLFSKRKSDSFFMNNHHVILPRIYHRKYDLNRKPKDWYQRFDDEMDKKRERDRWKQNRETKAPPDLNSMHASINSSAKVLKFFGDNPQNKTKVNRKLGASIDEIMKTRSLGIANITQKDDELRKKERKTFSRKTKFIEKISAIKLKFGSKMNQIAISSNDIESKTFLNNSDEETERNTDNDKEKEKDSDLNTMVIYPYNNGLKRNRKRLSEPRPNSGTLSIKIMENNEREKTRKSRTPNIEGIRNLKNGGYQIDQSLFTFQNPHINRSEKTKSSKKYNNSNHYNHYLIKKRKKSRDNVLCNKYGFKPNGKINVSAMKEQMFGLKKLLSQKKTLSEIVYIYYHSYGFCVEFIVYLIINVDIGAPQYISVISRHVDKQIKVLHGLSIWQYIIRHQLPHIDIQRFFHSFGPLIGKYKTLISPLHLSARKLIEIGGSKESHITSTTSSPECVYAFEIFKWLLFIGYDIDDGDVDNLITPQTILNHAPRILKQILSYQRQFLAKQRQCMKAVDNCIYRKYKVLLDDDILHVIEKFTYNKYRRSKTGKAHKKFVEI